MEQPDGDCVESSYSSRGNLLSEDRIQASQCPLARAARDGTQIQNWQYRYEARFNQIKSESDPNGNTTTYFYDYEDAPAVGDAGKLIRLEYPAVADETAQVLTPTVSYTYNQLGLLASRTDARGTITQYIYTAGSADEASGGTNPLFAAGVTPVPGLLTQLIEDFGGENLTSSSREFDAAGNAQLKIGPGGHNMMTYSHDAMNRIVSQTDAVAIVTTYQYDSRDNIILCAKWSITRLMASRDAMWSPNTATTPMINPSASKPPPMG